MHVALKIMLLFQQSKKGTSMAPARTSLSYVKHITGENWMITSIIYAIHCEHSVPAMDDCHSFASLTSATSFPSSTFRKAILQMIANQYMCRTTSIRSSPLNSMYMSGLKPSTCSTSKLQHSTQLQLTRAIFLVSCYIWQTPKQLKH